MIILNGIIKAEFKTLRDASKAYVEILKEVNLGKSGFDVDTGKLKIRNNVVINCFGSAVGYLNN